MSKPFRVAGLTGIQDPKEYLPFLRELRALDKHYQRFRIDDYLERRSKALASLKEGGAYRLGFAMGYRLTDRPGAERFDEAIAYITKYDLYNEALKLWAAEPEPVKVSRAFVRCALLTPSRRSTISTEITSLTSASMPMQLWHTCWLKSRNGP